ncbi:MAG: S41 family peptidase [Paludibacteraceae bacterium]|nr:S41 family peptidase [Paludibacteraceae bacterium]
MKRIRTLAAVFVLCFAGVHAESNDWRIVRNLSIFNDVMRSVDIAYVDTLNYNQMVRTAINAMLRSLDPYTVYYPKEDEDAVEQLTNGTYGGVGATIMQRADKQVCISAMYDDKPAHRAGLHVGDVLLEIDGVSTKGMSVSDVSKHLRGTPLSEICVKVDRYGEKKPLTFRFKREQIQIDPIFYSGIIAPQVGYVAFSEFTDGSAAAFRKAVEDLVDQHHIDRLVIDLQDNGGGLITEAVRLVSLFVEKGTEVTSVRGRGKTGQHTYKTTTQPTWPDMKLVVLVNENTASASEIVSGALQDLDRAVIIGERTYGKGLVQSLVPISFDGQLKVTTSKYYIPSGRCVQAIDYAHRDEQGRAKKIPDSLTHEFRTRAGRIVRDGRGITPDIILTDSGSYGISYHLEQAQLFFDFAVRYGSTHPAPESAEGFQVSDTLFNDFVRYVKEQNFTYKTASMDEYNSLLRIMRYESLDLEAQDELEALKQKLQPTIESAMLLDRQMTDQFLGVNLLNYYFGNQGVTRFYLPYNKVVQKAVSVITDDELMTRMLQGK